MWCATLLTRLIVFFRIPLILVLMIASCCVGAANANSWQNLGQPVFISPLDNSTFIDGPITSVTQDKSGFIWFIDSNGLWRWDSQTLLKARFASSPMIDVANTHIQLSYADKNGHIWVGTKRGIFRLNHGTNQLNAIAHEQLASISVKELVATTYKNEQILAFASEHSVYRFNINNKQLDTFAIPNNSRIHALHLDSNNRLWVGTEDALYYLPNVTHKKITLQKDITFPANIRISSILTTARNQLVIGTAAHGLFSKDPQDRYFSELLNSESMPWLYSMIEVRPNVLLLGTFGQGLIELNLTSGKKRSYRHNQLLPASLNDDDIWTLFQDAQGNVWIGCGNTLNLYDASNTAVQHLFASTNPNQGIQHRKVHSVQSLGNQLLVGTGKQGIEVLSSNSNTQLWWPGSNDPVETLYVSPNNKIYASSNFITVSIAPSTTQAHKINVEGRKPNMFTSAFAANDSTLWLGGTDGLWRQDTVTDSSTRWSNITKNHRIASLLVNKDTLWIGTWRGLYKQALPSSNHSPQPIILVNHPVISQQYISSLYIDSQEKLWVGTEGSGLFVLTDKTDWKHINTNSGLPSNIVSAIAGEHAAHVWLSSSKGVAAVNINSLKISSLVDGISTIQSPYTGGAGTQTDSGAVVFGGINGLTVIEPDKLSLDNKPTPLVLTNINITTKDNSVSSPSLIESQLVIPPLAKRLSFEFIALDYITPKRLQYRYRFYGLDDNWTLTDTEHRVATLTTPPPGEYILQLAYSRDGKTWINDTLSVGITILPAWYQTWLAKILGLLLLSTMVYIGHRIGVRHYRSRQTLLERRVQERTEDLVNANKKLSEQAEALKQASLTDPLTGLNNRRYLSLHIERDISLVQRYYRECKQNNVVPTNDSDLLFFLIDLDHFKQINDTYGHLAGDQVLIETQKRLKQLFRETDHLIRWGGEEFLVIVHNTPRDEANALAERIVKAIASHPFLLKDDVLKRVTCSIGYAVYPLSQQHFKYFSWQATIGFADSALYAAKNNNRNTWLGFSSLPSNVDKATLEKIAQHPSEIFNYAHAHEPDKKQRM